jgi:branched-chain amino acid transport system permease protein
MPPMLKGRGLWIGLAILLPLPWILPATLSGQVKDMIVFSILALGLNVVVGTTGLLHLGVAAFFGIGAYITGILTVSQFPFQWGVLPAMGAAVLGSALAGTLLAAPTLRLRGDYLAIVTLGFGEVVKFAIKNLENITNGSKSLNPIPEPWSMAAGAWGTWGYYLLALAALAAVVALLRNLERSKLGRAWMAVREDELAATCMGMNAAGVKLSAFAIGSALAGLAGALYAASYANTQGPDAYTFNRSITVLCFLIIGGMGNISGAIVGTFVLVGYDNLLTPILDGWVQELRWRVKFSDVKLIVFGLVLILMMRFRPQGILPARRTEGAA